MKPQTFPAEWEQFSPDSLFSWMQAVQQNPFAVTGKLKKGWSNVSTYDRRNNCDLQLWDFINGSLGEGNFMLDGSTPQISRAYWEIVLSLENFPAAAMFRITTLVHSLGFCKGSKHHQNRNLGNSTFSLTDSYILGLVIYEMCKCTQGTYRCSAQTSGVLITSYSSLTCSWRFT